MNGSYRVSVSGSAFCLNLKKGDYIVKYEYRFLPEYANHKRRELKKYWPKDKESQVFLRQKLDQIDKILWMAHRGHIILDEAMRLLSEI